MFIRKSTHEAVVTTLKASIAIRDGKAVVDAETIGRLQREKARLLGELADLKAKRARGNANLIPGGAKKKAAVMAQRVQSGV